MPQPVTAGQTNGERPTILIAEDEVMLRLVTAEVLSDAGFDVKEAPDGGEALKMLQSGDVHPVLVISDVKMPVMDGFELAQAAHEIQPDLKFLLMTGYSQAQLPPALSDAGVKVLQKPFDFDQLPDLVREILSKPTGKPH